MATMFMHVTSVGRANGSNAVARAAYVARDMVRAEALHRSFDYRARGGLEHSEILLPNGAAQTADWARDRGQLWNAAEGAEHQRNSRVAREYLIALPHEVRADARLELARGFAQTLADRYGAAIDLALHSAPPGGDPRNFHAHLLSTTREVNPDGLGRKTVLELDDGRRRELGLLSARNELRVLRHAWADRANEFLRDAGVEQRLDARSYWERGEAIVAQPRLTRAMIHLERSGARCDAANSLREQQTARQRLYAEMRHEHERSSRQPTQDLQPMIEPAPPERPEVGAESIAGNLSPAERDRLAAERWLAYRREQALGRSADTERAKDLERDRGAEFEM